MAQESKAATEKRLGQPTAQRDIEHGSLVLAQLWRRDPANNELIEPVPPSRVQPVEWMGRAACMAPGRSSFLLLVDDRRIGVSPLLAIKDTDAPAIGPVGYRLYVLALPGEKSVICPPLSTLYDAEQKASLT